MGKRTLPPGFRFQPTDVELVRYYLKRKVLGKKLHYDAIAEVDIYKFAPWDLPDKSRLRTGDLIWYFFCPREKKYASGVRMNRATNLGFWKATGKDRFVHYKDEVAGMKKTLVFHTGKAPKGDRTNWVMYEYRLEEKRLADQGVAQDAYVLCVVFKKDGPGPKNGAQYGAPFNEEDWDEDDQDGEEEEVNVQEGISCAGTSAPAFVLPTNHNGSIATSSHVPISVCNVSSVSYPSESLPLAYNPFHLVLDNNASTDAHQVVLEEVNGGETVSSTDVSATPLTLPVNQNSSILTRSSISCPAETLPSACKSPLMVSGIDAQGEHQDDILALLGIFSDENEKNENIDNLNLGGNVEDDPCWDGIDIFKDLGDFEILSGDTSFGGDNSEYIVNQMPRGDNGQYLELMDLDGPLNCIPVAGRYEHVRAGASHSDNNFFNYSEESCYPANPCSAAQLVTAFGQPPMLPQGLNGYAGQVNVFNEEDGVHRQANHGCGVYEPALHNENATHCETSEMGSRHASVALRRGEQQRFSYSKLQYLLESDPARLALAVENPAPITGVKRLKGSAFFFPYGCSSIYVKAEVTLKTDGCTNDALSDKLEESPFVHCEWCDLQKRGLGRERLVVALGLHLSISLVMFWDSIWFCAVALITKLVRYVWNLVKMFACSVILTIIGFFFSRNYVISGCCVTLLLKIKNFYNIQISLSRGICTLSVLLLLD